MRFILLFLFLTLPVMAEATVGRVGQAVMIEEVFIPGDQVAPIPRRDRAPSLVVRVVDVRSAEGGFRYDFEVQGLDPGEHDLGNYLESPGNAAIPAIPLKITTGLPDTPPRVHEIAPGNLPGFGGYRTMLIVAGVVWVLGLIVILLWRKRSVAGPEEDAPEPTLAERLEPLVSAASSGQLDSDQRAKLDRLIVGHWREKIPEVAALPPAEAMVELRRHPEAAPLILALEKWLHSPESTSDDDLSGLLAPYSRSTS